MKIVLAYRVNIAIGYHSRKHRNFFTRSMVSLSLIEASAIFVSEPRTLLVAS